MVGNIAMSLRDWFVIIGMIAIISLLINRYYGVRLTQKRTKKISLGLRNIKETGDCFASGTSKIPINSDFHYQFFNTIKKWLRSAEQDPIAARERIEPKLSGLETIQSNRSSKAEAFIKPHSYSNLEKEQPAPNHTITEENVPALTSVHAYQNDITEQLKVSFPKKEESFFKKTGTTSVVKNSISEQRPVESQYSKKSDNPVLSSVLIQNPHNKKQERLIDRPIASEILVINLLAKNGQFFDKCCLFQSLLIADMRYGDMSIFHRYTNKDGSGHILFSLSNGIEPGSFDINNLETMEIPAISIFMGLPGPREPLKAFMLMEETAKNLACNLGGELKDEHFSVLTQQTLEHCRQRIRDFGRKQLTQQLSD